MQIRVYIWGLDFEISQFSLKIWLNFTILNWKEKNELNVLRTLTTLKWKQKENIKENLIFYFFWFFLFK